MKDEDKTKEQLLEELKSLNDRLAELEKTETERRRTEDALRESEERYRNFIETAHDMIQSVSPDGSFVFVNRAWLQTLGYTEAELPSLNLFDVIYPCSLQHCQEVFSKIISGQRVTGIQATFVTKDGKPVFVEGNASARFLSGKLVATHAIFRDITERKGAEEERRKREEQLIRHQTALLELAKLDYSELDSALKRITELDSKTLGVERVSIWLLNKDGSEIISEDLYKMSENSHEKGLRLQARQYPIYFQALEENLIIAANNARTDPRTKEFSEGYLKPLGITSMMDVPIWLHGKVCGIVCHEHVGPRREWTEQDQDFAAAIADMVSLSFESSRRRRAEEDLKQSLEKLQRSIEGTINAMALTVEMRDPYTAGHQRRVTDLACAIAREMGLSEDEIRGIHLAGVIHDLGKIYVPAEILSKPGQLSKIELSMVKTHPKVGYDILKAIDFPWPIAQIVLQHHERMDGSGYPQGLSDGDIIPEARILGVADVVEAMASHRPYRPALGIDKALEEISQNKGILYDSKIADACLKLFTEKRFEFK